MILTGNPQPVAPRMLSRKTMFAHHPPPNSALVFNGMAWQSKVKIWTQARGIGSSRKLTLVAFLGTILSL